MTDDGIRSQPVPECYLCGHDGALLYSRLSDRLYEAPGEWTLKKCSNPDCGLIWLDPMPLPEDLGKAYTGYFTHSRAEKRLSPLQRAFDAIKSGYRRTRFGYSQGVGPRWYGILWAVALLHWYGRSGVEAETMYLPAPSNGKRILDVGFGGGELLDRLTGLGWDAEGVDTDPIAVDQALKRGLNVRCGTLAEQCYPDESFDCVAVQHVLEHVPDPVGLLSECRRVLKPGGVLSAVVPNSRSLGHRRFGSNWVHLDPPRHLYVFDVRTLSALADAAGFGDKRVFSVPRGVHGVWLMSTRIKSPVCFAMKPIPRKIGATGFQLLERALVTVDSGAGEEAVLIARKSTTDNP